MNLALSEEQTMIRDSAADVLAERSASAAACGTVYVSGASTKPSVSQKV